MRDESLWSILHPSQSREDSASGSCLADEETLFSAGQVDCLLAQRQAEPAEKINELLEPFLGLERDLKTLQDVMQSRPVLIQPKALHWRGGVGIGPVVLHEELVDLT